MWNRSVERGEVVAIEVVGAGGARRAIAIDLSDLPLAAAERRWSVRPDGYAISSRGRLLHRLIAGVTDRRTVVSHANGRRLDCRRRNLVVTTRAAVSRAIVPLPSTGVRYVRHQTSSYDF